ncbi:alternative ribosome rescue aminoacyl-tRNA hydrolase ArfB [Salidesulfovibrio onnuriiensis]|uniref:alternative ribosome rescue aminoacyl-tRNA hydrolase ArfB n=1 Tax=Salidesulfovibrio onnuriiensis TaxID=2583823 RepID=UPI00202ADF21|nr:alternative ribosome rescue aminoacyl-tRNA hydrolase ArfB [Salidesulfovibrio onnuriiensis]
MSMIYINDKVSIPEEELRFSFSRSPGPGGQHVNTTATKATVFFDVEKTRSLTQLQKVSVRGKLRRRMDKNGVLRISAHDFRSQKGNRDAVLDRFVELMRWALKPVTPRKPTMPTLSSVRRTQDRKRRLAEKKRMRRSPRRDDW